ncbi:MAG: hypothetical protein HOP10_01440 [Chitinophagaceae bacterium]|nr:hypothetical protein [Chitinophagaceae bacterium]
MFSQSTLLLIILSCTVPGTAQIKLNRIPEPPKPPIISKGLNTESPIHTSSPYKIISIVAGSGIESRDAGSNGTGDGVGRNARFYKPFDIISDGKGGFLIADFLNYRIRQMTTDGTVTTFAGSSQGQEDGSLTEGRLYSPVSICLDKNGDLIVADKNWNAVRKITKTGIITIAGGNGIGNDNGDAKTATFNRPVSVAVNSKGDIFVCDEGNHVIRKISGNTVSTYAGNGNGGYADGAAAAADFLYPKAITVDVNDNVYVAEGTMIRKITPAGMVSTLAGQEGVQGRRDGKGSKASFSALTEIIAGPSGILYVVDAGTTDALSEDHSVNLRYRNGGAAIRLVSPDGSVQTVVGSYICTLPENYFETHAAHKLNDGPVNKAFFNWDVFGICLDEDENIYVADAWLNCIRKVSK